MREGAQLDQELLKCDTLGLVAIAIPHRRQCVTAFRSQEKVDHGADVLERNGSARGAVLLTIELEVAVQGFREPGVLRANCIRDKESLHFHPRVQQRNQLFLIRALPGIRDARRGDEPRAGSVELLPGFSLSRKVSAGRFVVFLFQQRGERDLNAVQRARDVGGIGPRLDDRRIAGDGLRKAAAACKCIGIVECRPRGRLLARDEVRRLLTGACLGDARGKPLHSRRLLQERERRGILFERRGKAAGRKQGVTGRNGVSRRRELLQGTRRWRRGLRSRGLNLLLPVSHDFRERTDQ